MQIKDSKNKKTGRIKIYIILVTAVVAITAAVTLVLRPDLIFIITDTYYQAVSEIKITETVFDNSELKEFSVEDIKSGETFSYNQSLMLINAQNPLPFGFAADTGEYKDSGVIMNTCIMDAYLKLSAGVMEQTGDKLFVISSFRTEQEQKEIYKTDATLAANVGASEHQTGLALDVYVSGFSSYGFIKSEAGRYVNQNSWKYGFVIRYPRGKKDITGIPYEPWHIRYVGLPHAEIMYKNSLCLEEYMDSLEPRKYYSSEGYIISRQTGDMLYVPSSLTDVVISPDGMGGHIITGRNSSINK